ncbi:acyltransferase [Daejeonella sp. H1SJ63]|uniref:acyltransferase n=1 Tax=Daejeonella sp. H1SJ63 TaxID=3034145 RepID=UPI0023EE085D|nr:acyltransferase [Daejeonella sp. H1SJ63]
MLKIFAFEFSSFIEWFLNGFPGYTGMFMRRIYYKLKLNTCGDKLSIGTNTKITPGKNISIGDNFTCFGNDFFFAFDNGTIEIGNNVSINYNVNVNSSQGGQVIIGNDVLIASNVVIRTSSHVYLDMAQPIRTQGHKSGCINIHDDVWIGSNVTILPDVTIGKGSIIAAGSLVNKNVEEYSIYGGVPAKFIKKRL